MKKLLKTLTMVCISTFLVFLFLGLLEARADVITVDDDGGADHKTIQSAVDAAGSVDIIQVAQGNYTGSIRIDKRITLRGASCNNTTISGSVSLYAHDVNISGFRITDGGVTIRGNENRISNCNFSGNYYGVEIYGFSEHPVYNNITWNYFYNNTKAAVKITQAQHNTISGNQMVSEEGSAVYLWYSKDITIINNLFLGPGLYMGGDRSSHWDSHVIDGNTVNGKPVIYRNHWSVEIPENVGQVIFAGTGGRVSSVNFSACGVGVLAGYSSHVEVLDCSFQGLNQGISFRTVRDSSIQNNSFSQCGTGIILCSGSRVQISENHFSNNSNGIYIHFFSSFHEIERNVFSGNRNAGIYCSGSGSGTSMLGNSFLGNKDGICLKYSVEDTIALVNTFHSNTDFGINASSGCRIRAHNNWWGDVSGPYHDDVFPQGKGDRISDHVNATEWLTEPYAWPEVWLEELSPAWIYEGENLSFSWGSDVFGSVANYTLWYGGVYLYHGKNTSFVCPDLGSGSSGSSVYLKVQDNFGIWSRMKTIATLEVVRKPLVRVSGPTPNSFVSGLCSIHGKMDDPKWAMPTVQLRINGGNWINLSVDQGGNWKHSLDTTEMENGALDLEFQGIRGNYTTELVSRSVEIYNPPQEDDDEGSDSSFPGPESFVILAILFFCLILWGAGRRMKNRKQGKGPGSDPGS